MHIETIINVHWECPKRNELRKENAGTSIGKIYRPFMVRSIQIFESTAEESKRISCKFYVR
jgi:hypothetical protein